MKSEKITVKGMTCANCVGHVTNAVKNLPGVTNVDVSLADSSATFDYNPETLSLADVVAAIDEEGYSASPISR